MKPFLLLLLALPLADEEALCGDMWRVSDLVEEEKYKKEEKEVT